MSDISVVSFPGLGLKFNINKIFISIGNIDIYWYGLLIVVAFIISLILLKKVAKEKNIDYEKILELFVLIVPISIICARIYYIVFNLDYYLNHPKDIININSGGLAIYGGIIGGVISIYLYSKFKKINFTTIIDMIVIVLPLGQAIGRWGNFFNVEAYGSITESVLRMGIIENGNYIEVHPTFLYESIMCLGIFFILYIRKNKENFNGENVCIYLFMYGLVRSVIESLRQDALLLGNIKVSMMLSIILCIVFGSILLYKNLLNLKA